MNKRWLVSLATLTLCLGCVDRSGDQGLTASNSAVEAGLISYKSNFSASETANRLVDAINANDALILVERVDHQQNALNTGLTLDPTQVVIFGNPNLGTPLMQCAPQVAIDLPQKMLIQEDAAGQVLISYNSTAYLRDRHNIQGCDEQLATIAGALEGLATGAAGL